jgi:hypothetical protein
MKAGNISQSKANGWGISMSSYDDWKTRSDYDEEARYYSGPSNKQIREKVETLDREIGWLTTRLANLSLSDEDFDQTQDYIFELRQERESLKRCFNV